MRESKDVVDLMWWVERVGIIRSPARDGTRKLFNKTKSMGCCPSYLRKGDLFVVRNSHDTFMPRVIYWCHEVHAIHNLGLEWDRRASPRARGAAHFANPNSSAEAYLLGSIH